MQVHKVAVISLTALMLLACSDDDGPVSITCTTTLILAANPLRAQIGVDAIPTGFDAANSAGCEASQPVTGLRFVLDGPGGMQVAEVPFNPPRSRFGIPLPGTDEVPVVDAALTPGTYTREVQALVLAGSPWVLEGFDDVELYRGNSQQQAALDAAREQWAEQALTRYRYTARWTCFCAEDFVAEVAVEVQDGAVQSVSFTDPQRQGVVPSPERFRTMEGMFGYVQDAIYDDVANLNASYDAQQGFPSSVYIDPNAMMADEEYGFAINAVTATR